MGGERHFAEYNSTNHRVIHPDYLWHLMYESTTQIRVRYGETDQMGFLYYGYYALYYEVGRAEAIRQLGFTYRELEALGIQMPVVELNAEYLRPALYDDLITVKTILKELPLGSKVEFHSELYN